MPLSIPPDRIWPRGSRWGKLADGQDPSAKSGGDIIHAASSRRHQMISHPFLVDPGARKEFEELTQALLEAAAIEIMDQADDDPDLEPDSDEFQDEDGT
jgi:hypothetical protein